MTILEKPDVELDNLLKGEVERALIAMMASRTEILHTLAGQVTADDFGLPEHREAFRRVSEAALSGHAAVPLGVLGDLLGSQSGMADKLRPYDFQAPSAKTAQSLARVVTEMAKRRSLLATLDEARSRITANTDAAAETAEALVGFVLSQCKSIAHRRNRSDLKRTDVARQVVDDLEKPIVRYKSGLKIIDDRALGGIFPERVYAFAGGAKSGKTTVGTTISHHLGIAGVSHLLMSWEVSPKEMEQRRLAYLAGVDLLDLTPMDSDRVSPDVVAKMREAARQPNTAFYEHDTLMDIGKVKMLVDYHLSKNDIKVLILDYWQLIGTPPAGISPAHYFNMVAQELAEIAKGMGLGVVVTAQLNTRGEERDTLYQSDGLRRACDQLYFIKRCYENRRFQRERLLKAGRVDQAAKIEIPSEFEFWLKMEESRYTPKVNAGDDENPALWLSQNGLAFVDRHNRDF